MDLLIKLGQFILIISILVVLHEFGHYLPAKLFGTRVEKFFLFFDYKFAIYKKKIGDTVFGIGWLPLGGYVKISGMIDESMDKAQMEGPVQPWEFRAKPAWQRLIIMIGGVVVNFLLSWVIYSCMLFNYGASYVPASGNGVVPDELGTRIGFKYNDEILSIDDAPIKTFMDARFGIAVGDKVTVLRAGKKHNIHLTAAHKKEIFEDNSISFIRPKLTSHIGFVQEDSFAQNLGLKVGDKILTANGKSMDSWGSWIAEIKASKGDTLKFTMQRPDNSIKKHQLYLPKEALLGVSPDYKKIMVTDNYGVFASITGGFSKTTKVLTDQVRQFKVILNPKTEAYKKVSGPVGMVNMMPTSWNAQFFWQFLAMLSVWLAFVNILPIPALDGGHVMFLLYEVIARKKPNQRIVEYGQVLGFIILMSLMLLIFGNDIWNVFIK